MIPTALVVAAGGVMLALAAMYVGFASREAWRDWWSGNGIDVRFTLAMGVSALFIGGGGAMILRRHLRYGHLQAVYRVDASRGVFTLQDERIVLSREWDLECVWDVRVRDVRLPWGLVFGVLLIVRIRGERFACAAVFRRSERDAVQGFAGRLREAAEARTKAMTRAGTLEGSVAPVRAYPL
jgi:hypothetical protein